MHNVLMPRPAPPPNAAVARHAPAESSCLHPSMRERNADHQFVAMLNSYRGSGGLARATDVVSMFAYRRGPDVATLARWIVERAVISFEWESKTWLPLFQFNRSEMKPRRELRPLFAELTPVYDAWELANWFSRPNPGLADRSPVQTIAYDLTAVLHAARAVRSVANR
jgi:hypothetical protein